MTKSEFEEFVEKVSVKGSVYGLESIKALLARMDNPEKRLRFVHIAGTNGKGSVLAFTSTILKCAGYKVGRYISPVIKKYNEKIQIGGKSISQVDLYEGMENIKNICEQMVNEGLSCPTIFEIETALAFWYFDKKKVDIVVLETGMGGRDDATNVIPSPEVAVLTSISMDHMAILGSTLEDITRVKAGIIKKGVSVVSAPQAGDASKVILDTCKEQEAVLTVATSPSKVKYGLEKQTFNYREYNSLEISLIGTYQPDNAAVALEVIKCLSEKGFKICESAIRKGLAETKWDGRFTVISKKPLFIIDGAHNHDAAKRLRESIDVYLKGRPLIYIMGVFADKEYKKVIQETADAASFIIALQTPGNKRALPAVELAGEIAKVNSNVTTADSIEEAVEMALVLAGKGGSVQDKKGAGKCAILAFGSLSFLGKLQDYVVNSGKNICV